MERFFYIFCAMLIVIANVNAQSDLSRVTYESGAYYIGEVNAQHKPHGKGTYYYADGSVYEGDWVNNEMHGKGTITDEKGNRYTGYFANDKEHGKGILIFSQGFKCEVEMRNGEIHEQGEIEFLSDTLPKKGEIKYPNGDHYEGELNIHGEPHGNGILTKANGIKYEGNMVNGSPHGLGTMTLTNGSISVGKFIHGYRHGQFTTYLSNGTRLECEFQHDKPHGKGKAIDKDGNVSYKDF